MGCGMSSSVKAGRPNGRVMKGEGGCGGGAKNPVKEAPNHKTDEESTASGDLDRSESSYSADSAYPPGPLLEGEYIWNLETPAKMFSTAFGEADWAKPSLFYEVWQFRLTYFLGAGAGGTVYKATYRNSAGRTILCAIKFAGTIPGVKPDSHDGVKKLLLPRTKEWLSMYEAEKGASGILRAETASQYQKYASGRIRMLQLLGVHDTSQALVLDYVKGSTPAFDPVLMQSVRELLKQAAEERRVEVGDVKLGNLIQDSSGVTTIIDFGFCQYLGGATCRLCNKSIEEEVDVHAQEHVAEYLKQHRVHVCSRLHLQEFCFGKMFC